jgi:hypothetical protein
MHAVHPNARTTPAVRAEIARSAEPTGVVQGGDKTIHGSVGGVLMRAG